MREDHIPETAAWAVNVPVGYEVGPWRVTRGIATGSWGSVYAARRSDRAGDADAAPDLPDEVALKFLQTGTVTGRRLAHIEDQVRRETRLRERFSHARVIRTYEALTVDDPATPKLDGAVVLVMERAVESLQDVLARCDGMPAPDAGRYIEEICEGLVELHAAGWIHGDLKPENVLITADGSVRLADFGLAAEVHGTHGYLPPSGSPDYVPPERWSEPLSPQGTAVRTTADIWALGVTAHQLLTGRLPFPGPTPAARGAAVAEYAAGDAELRLHAGLSVSWRALIEDCLSPDHTRRKPHDIANLLVRVREINRSALPDSRPMYAARPTRARRWAALAAAFALGSTVATGATAATVSNYLERGDRGSSRDSARPAVGPGGLAGGPTGTPTGPTATAGPVSPTAPTGTPTPTTSAPALPSDPLPPARPGPRSSATAPPRGTQPPASPPAKPSRPKPDLPKPEGSCTGSFNPPTVTDSYEGGRGPFATKWCTSVRSGSVFWDPFTPDRIQVGTLGAGTKAFVCQKHHPDYGWFVYGKSDVAIRYKGWGWYPAADLSGGEEGGPVPGLADCNEHNI